MLIARLSACGASARLALRSWASPQCLVQLRRGLGTRKQKIFELAKGFRGRSKNCWRLARNSVHRALQHAYKGRRLKRRTARQRWIMQINAGAREYNLTYGSFIHGLSLARVELNRKVLAQLAIQEPYSFRAIIGRARDALAQRRQPAA